MNRDLAAADCPRGSCEDLRMIGESAVETPKFVPDQRSLIFADDITSRW
jgi:hypothetical protein